MRGKTEAGLDICFEHLPMRELRPFVDCIWYSDPTTDVDFDIVPDGCVDACFVRSRSASAVVRNDNAATKVALSIVGRGALVGHDISELLFDLRNCVGLTLPARESLMNRCEVSVGDCVVARACCRGGSSHRTLEEHVP